MAIGSGNRGEAAAKDRAAVAAMGSRRRRSVIIVVSLQSRGVVCGHFFDVAIFDAAEANARLLNAGRARGVFVTRYSADGGSGSRSSRACAMLAEISSRRAMCATGSIADAMHGTAFACVRVGRSRERGT